MLRGASVALEVDAGRSKRLPYAEKRRPGLLKKMPNAEAARLRLT